jgi:hypothetical protein
VERPAAIHIPQRFVRISLLELQRRANGIADSKANQCADCAIASGGKTTVRCCHPFRPSNY